MLRGRRLDRARLERRGTTGIPGLAAYAAAKAGVIGLGRQLAVDYGPDGIRANVLCPARSGRR